MIDQQQQQEEEMTEDVCCTVCGLVPPVELGKKARNLPLSSLCVCRPLANRGGRSGKFSAHAQPHHAFALGLLGWDLPAAALQGLLAGGGCQW